MSRIKVLVNGAAGKMGQTMLGVVAQDPDTVPVAGVDKFAPTADAQVPGFASPVPLAKSLDALPPNIKPDVLLDFSVAEATLPAVRWAAEHGINFVVGTTGLSPDDVKALERLAVRHGVGGMAASNFALGAVVMMYLSKKAAPFFDYVEIIETHHETKVDAPSGTAITTARMIAEARGKAFKRNEPTKQTIPGTRAGSMDGVTIHSVRLPGTMAHQEVIFGTAGQTLSIKHDTINRDCYGPGVLMGIKHVAKNKGFIYGLDKLLGLEA